MTIPLGNVAGGADFAFDSDRAAAARGQISSLAEAIQALPGQAEAQSEAPDFGSDPVSKAFSELLASQHEAVAAGSARLSDQLHAAAERFASSAKEIDETESASAGSLAAHPAAEA